MARDTYKYHFKKGNKIVHTGITNGILRGANKSTSKIMEMTGTSRRSAGQQPATLP